MTTNQIKRINGLKYNLEQKDHEINYLRRRLKKIKEDLEKVLEPYYNEKR